MIKALLALIILLTFNLSCYASNLVGGEISWICDGPNRSQFRFSLTVYIDCDDITNFGTSSETINIYGTSLPRNAAGQPFNSITVNWDITRFLAERNGDFSPRCNTQIGTEYTCANHDPGTMQAFHYQSDLITMSGVPPNGGWTFYWERICCRPLEMDNGVVTNGTKGLLLRAIMFPTKNKDNVNPCIDDSPEFRSIPASYICRGQLFTYNPIAIDNNLDSLVYSWGIPLFPPISMFGNLEYNPRFSPTNPTPDKTFDINNVPSTLNPISGVHELAIFSGFGAQKFLVVYRVDAWRDGVPIASIFRELPLSVFDCPRVPQTNNVNTVPQVRINGVPSTDTFVTVTAGQEVRVRLQITDPDPQMVTVVPDGLMFTNDKKLNTLTNCPNFQPKNSNAVINPCAYLTNIQPSLDQSIGKPTLTGMFGLATEFIWQTDCSHISIKTGQPGTREGIYNFVFRVSDDHCPIPGINYVTITVLVKDPIPLTEPIMKGASVGLDDQVTYQWVPPIDSAFTFDSYKVEAEAVLDGDPASFNPAVTIENKLRRYQQSSRAAFNIHVPIGGNPANGADILTKRPNRDWFFRMSSVSGCTAEVPSVPSEPVRVMEVDAVPVGTFPDPPRSVARLTWNRPKPLNAATKSYFEYESRTRYYIWENDSISNGGVANPNNWYLRGNTENLTMDLETNVCGDYAGFRIEARDTVITWRRGTGPGSFPKDSLITLTYSTFSTIDTLFMVDRGFIPRPRLDTIEVKANGDVYLRIDRSNTGTTGKYSIYANAAIPANFITSFELEDQDSILVGNQGADTQVKTYIIEGEDACNPSIKQLSLPYTTFIPQGVLTQPECSLLYRLTWSAPQGFATGVAGYRIYVDRDNDGRLDLEQTLAATATTTLVQLARDRPFSFQVVAFDSRGAVNMSAIHRYTVPPTIRSFDLVAPMNLRCTYVEDNGEVTLSWPERDAATEDPTNNFDGADGYRFEYRLNNGAWTPYNPGNLVTWEDTSLTIAGINAQNGRYDIRVRVLSGCSGSEPSGWTQISTIDINADARPNDIEKRADISWNSTGVNRGNSPYALFKDTFDLRYSPNVLSPGVNNESFVDNGNTQVCDGVFNYFVTIEDEFSGCLSRSNIDNARILDEFPPEPIRLDYVSYNLETGGIDAYWSENNPGDVDSLLFTTTDGFNSGLQAFRGLLRERWNITPKQVEIPFNILDARDSSVVVGAITQDACDNRSSENDLTFHKTIDIDVLWSVCDSSMTLTWNPYVGFPANFEVEYRVYRSTTGNSGDWQEIIGSTTTDTTYVDKITVGDLTYFYHVRASSLDPTAANFVSNSNIASDRAIFEDVPRFGYLRYVTVLPSNEIELEFNKDTLINVRGYNIYKGKDKEFLTPIGFVDYNTVRNDETFNFVDADVDVEGYSYYYKVVTQSACDVMVDTSNFGRSILLNIEPNNEALTNTLQWNAYEEWDSTVAYYNVYRGVDRLPTNQVHAVVSPSQSAVNSYIDDVFDAVFSIGKFCYVVEAVQGPVTEAATNGFPNDLEPATSRSNVVCVTQEPLFYVPNAFAPDGINQVFGPKGQFFDFSLYEMVIYNRWGEEIYRTRDINKGWDGVYNGSIVPIGSYVYMIRFIDADGQEHRRKGTVTVIR